MPIGLSRLLREFPLIGFFALIPLTLLSGLLLPILLRMPVYLPGSELYSAKIAL